MPNTPQSISSPSNTESNLSHLQDSAQRFMTDAKTKALDLVEGVSDTASSLYSQAGDALQSKPGKIAGAAAVVLAAGVIGYFIGRGSREDFGSAPIL
jgi:hypothetical protein